MALVLVVTLAGCSSSLRQHAYHLHQKVSFKVGDKWIIKPPRVLTATRIEMTRKLLVDSNEDAGEQKLVLDLTDGRATFQDAGGRDYAQQVPLATVQRIGAYMTDRSWQISRAKADEDALNPATYSLVVYEGDTLVKPEVTWGDPSARPLPDSLTLLTSTFQEAYRGVHPLAEEVDLLE